MAGLILALAASVLAQACDSSSGGSDCFPPEHGPADTSCTGFAVGLTCPVSVTPFYSCVCTAAGAQQSWVCTPQDGSGGSPGTGGDLGTGGTGGGDGGTTTSTGAGGTDGGGTDGGGTDGG